MFCMRLEFKSTHPVNVHVAFGGFAESSFLLKLKIKKKKIKIVRKSRAGTSIDLTGSE